MSYKNYITVSDKTIPKFDKHDTDAGSDIFKDTTKDYPEVDQALGTVVYKSLATVDFSDDTKLKAFQEKFLATDNGKFAAYPTKELGNFFSADIINVVRRMQDPTGNQFIIPVPSNLKDRFSKIFQSSITNRVVSYENIPGLFRFELDFNDGRPAYNQVLQLRSFMTLMEKEYSTMTGTEVTTGQVSADNIATKLGPDMATLYDFASESVEGIFESQTMLSPEFPEVDGTILNAYLHARQNVAIDQPLKANDFFTHAMDDSYIQRDFLGVKSDYFDNKTYLDYIQEGKATLSYKAFEQALGLNGKTENWQWKNESDGGYSWVSFNSPPITPGEKADIQQVLTDFNAIYVTISWDIVNTSGVTLGKDVATGIYEPISGFKMITVNPQINAGVTQAELDALDATERPDTQDTAKKCFDEYLTARGF